MFDAQSNFQIINEYQSAKISRDKIKLPKSIDHTYKIKNEFVKGMANLLTIKAFLFKYGYDKCWNRISIIELYESYALLRIKDYE